MKISIPEFCLVVLVGASGSGKSTFASRHFLPTEIVSSDWARGLVDDDETSLNATADAFALVHYIAEKRLSRRKLTVIDATNVRPEDRAQLVRIAKKHHALAVAMVINPPEDLCHERNLTRPDRQFGRHVVRNHVRALKRGLKRLGREGFRYVHELCSVEEIEQVEIVREQLWTDRRHEHGPFDIIGDVHGCCDELVALLQELGYGVAFVGEGEERRAVTSAPEGRRAFFVGDLVDRGPKSPDVLRIVMAMAEAGHGLCVPGNHDAKFLRWLNGRNVKLTHGLAETAEQFGKEPPSFHAKVKTFIDGLVSHAWLEGGRLAIAHAGIKEDMMGRSSGFIREFCLYGETSGETDEYGLPVRYNWAADYRGQTTIVYGHTPVPEAEWLNNTLCIDTGCCFGGKLTALRWPEKEIVSVPAQKAYAERLRPLGHPPPRPGVSLSAQQQHDDLLDIEDVIGKRLITSRLGRSIQIPDGNAAAALEVMTRFGISPKWLIYLLPTMSPSETSGRESFLEHPDEAFDYFRREGAERIIAEEKHMGSRACIIVCRDADAAVRRFGVTTGESGAVYTRTGRAFFADAETTEAVIARVRSAMMQTGFWKRHETDWALLDAEIMPWSVKAQSLIQGQYAATAAAARAGLGDVVQLLEKAAAGGADVGELQARFTARHARAEMYADAYRRYCWPVNSLDDYRIAPFHLLATQGAVHMDKDHSWHMDELARIAAVDDPMLMATAYRIAALDDEAGLHAITDWWLELTGRGGEGMVVKPMQFIARGQRGMMQPAIKCRGPEYLRIIYGPEYDAPEHLDRLRRRGLGLKRSLATREFVLGHEALHRFVEGEPLRRVHECVSAVLALESEPVDPRL